MTTQIPDFENDLAAALEGIEARVAALDLDAARDRLAALIDHLAASIAGGDFGGLTAPAYELTLTAWRLGADGGPLRFDSSESTGVFSWIAAPPDFGPDVRLVVTGWNAEAVRRVAPPADALERAARALRLWPAWAMAADRLRELGDTLPNRRDVGLAITWEIARTMHGTDLDLRRSHSPDFRSVRWGGRAGVQFHANTSGSYRRFVARMGKRQPRRGRGDAA